MKKKNLLDPDQHGKKLDPDPHKKNPAGIGSANNECGSTARNIAIANTLSEFKNIKNIRPYKVFTIKTSPVDILT